MTAARVVRIIDKAIYGAYSAACVAWCVFGLLLAVATAVWIYQTIVTGRP